MIFPETAALPQNSGPTPEIHSLSCGNAAEMLALMERGYPGYFRAETCRMGRYWGLRDEHGALIAMGGERLVLAPPGEPVWAEISALCTDPAHPGRGLGTILLRHILARHRAERTRSWLHVTETNARALALYRRVGFQSIRQIDLCRIRRNSS